MPFLAAAVPAAILAAESAAGTMAAVGATAGTALTGASLLAPAVTGASLAGATFAPLAAVGTGATLATSTLASAATAIPWMSAISTGGQLLTGISSRMSEAAQRNAEAKAIMQQTRQKERQQFAQASDVEAKQHALGASSGLDTTSGSPLSMMIDTITTGEKNAQNTYTQGRLQASQRRAEGQQAGGFGGIAGTFADALTSKPGSILSQFFQSRFA